ncbi:unnamed protein product [Cuscuta europaea]|uniref:Uncharacterized protein n=1 Tax=Cuscuta europaea TaxID=41803 RepID=A0A9P0Z228_CUSEU|nr:unnamed protein product [Cuscuta europaea]
MYKSIDLPSVDLKKSFILWNLEAAQETTFLPTSGQRSYFRGNGRRFRGSASMDGRPANFNDGVQLKVQHLYEEDNLAS